MKTPKNKTKERQKKLRELDKKLTDELDEMLPSVLKLFSKEKGTNCTVHSLHGTIGSKNTTYVDVVNATFSDPADFKAKWIAGFIEYIGANRYSPMRKLMKNKLFRKYTFTFLERNFYRNRHARVREKPNENLWTVWFGHKGLFWGLMIAPVFRNGIWSNDVSEIRRAKFTYWTIGHVLSTGLIDPENNKLYEFTSLKNLMDYYEQILKRLSSSKYEKEIFDKYVKYVFKTNDPYSEPFLIPEFRYKGLEEKHEHRLDFTILNAHTMEKTGFELSPSSSHMSVVKMSGKKQKDVNLELKEKWNDEMEKRNKYFSKYDIHIVTFADDDLEDIDDCFEKMEEYLMDRSDEELILDEQISRLDNL